MDEYDWKAQTGQDKSTAAPQPSRARRIGWGVGLLAAGALAGAVISGSLPALAQDATPSPSNTAGSNPYTDREQDRGAREEQLTADTAEKVRAAALAEVPGGTVDRLEKDADGAAYEAHLTTADGTHVTVKLDENFNVTAVETGGAGGCGGGDRGAGPGRGEAES